MKLSFYGAAGEVTGSNYLLEAKNASLMVDCGAFQGGKEQELKNAAPFLFNPNIVDSFILTHAHLDHVGRVAKLVKDGYRGHIWCTPATMELAELIMLDAAKIMSHEELKFGDEPLYHEQDVYRALRQFKTLDYETKIEIAPGIEARLVDAGHILGSASVEVWAGGKKLLFSGDIGNKGAPIIKDPNRVDEADYVICESTYGGRTHESIEDRRVILKTAIDHSIAKGGVLLIPAFALERSQELLYELHDLLTNHNIKALPIFLDSPLAIKTTEVFGHFPEYYDNEAKEIIHTGKDFFELPGLQFTETVEQSKRINKTPPPKMIIAGSGMMTGGRIRYHLKEYLGSPQTTILIAGYQVKGTLGRRILDGVKTVDLFHEPVAVKAEVIACGAFSAHADHKQLMDWLTSVKTPVRQIFFTHGDREGLVALEQAVSKELNWQTHIPRFGEHITL
ncbi:MBL fold metallo-hydrolase [Candidatus Berkelbacteria bacterium]|nr:MBL fold metallo-hydrolase [Candidatus Berkelbacteria bacterium]